MEHMPGHDFTYKQYALRWVVLAIVFLCNWTLQVIFISFAPIATLSADYYNVDQTAINWLMLVWAILFLPATLLAAYGSWSWGVRRSLIAASSCMLLGALIRLSSLLFDTRSAVEGDTDTVEKVNGGGAYAVLLVGTVFIAAVQPLFLASTTQVAAAWFSEKQRTTANALMSIANPLGLATGSLLAPAFAKESAPNGIDHLLIFQAAMAGLCVLSCIFVKSAPPTAPSSTAAYTRHGTSIWEDLQSLRNNFGFLTLCNVFSLSVGGFQALLILLDQILKPQGYSADDTGNIAAVLILSGIVGAVISAPVLDATRAYKISLAACMTVLLPFYIAFTYMAQREDRHPQLLILAAFVGFFGFPVLPIALDMSAEITYPIPASLTSAFLWCGSQVTAVVLVVLIDGPLADSEDDDGNQGLEAGTWLLVGCVSAAGFMAWLWSGRYVRQEAEETVRRLQQAQRRDVGLPFVDIISDVGKSGQAVSQPPTNSNIVAMVDDSRSGPLSSGVSTRDVHGPRMQVAMETFEDPA